MDEIVVTGSLLGRTDASASQPVSVVGAKELMQSGKLSVLEVLRTVPAVGTASSGQTFGIGGAGVQSVNLRNAGSRRTLVLVNGRRFPLYSDINGLSSQDVSGIPTAMVGRIEILRDGAASTYGADAVAGVVNFLTRDRFEGLEVSGYGGLSSRGDGQSYRFSAILGHQFDRGSIVVSAQQQRQDDIAQIERRWARDVYSSLGGASGITRSDSTPGGAVRGTDGALVACYPITGGQNIAPSCERYDTGGETSLVAGFTIRSFGGAARYDISDNVRLKADVLLSHRDGFQSLSGFQLNTAGFVGPFKNLVVPSTSPNNPYGRDVSLNWRMSDYGSRPTRTSVDMTFVSAGLEGRLLDRFKWDVSHSVGRNSTLSVTDNGVNAVALRGLLNPDICANDQRCAGIGAISNLDDLLSKKTRLTEAQKNYLFYDQTAKLEFTSAQSLATISGPVFTLPSGPVMVAIGLEHRKETGEVMPDAFTQSGDAASNTILPTDGHFSTRELFTEATIPLLSEVQFAQNLDLNLQGRHSRFSNFGSANIYKVGLNWSVSDELRIRTSYGTSFRAPDVIEVYGGGVADYGGYNDPCRSDTFRQSNPAVDANCVALGVPSTFNPGNTIPRLTGGSPSLQPERGKSFNLGLVYKPGFFAGFTAVVDYYDLRVTDAIGSIVQDNLNSCYLDPNLRTRAQDPNDICFTFASRNSDGTLARIQARQTNIGTFSTSGVDYTFQYKVAGVLGGDVDVSLSGAYLINADFGRGNLAGRYNESLAGSVSNPRVRGSLTVNYDADRWGAQTRVNYVSAMKDANVGISIPVDNFKNYSGTPFYTSMDVLVRYDVSDSAQLTVGVNNLFDKDPPYAFNFLKNALISTFDVIGRFGYVSFTQKF
ncbi:TonB-dependent receptor [Brevundimonas sp.]|uniref:TonB-dependent receptor plug domain-containing protein n=1 Tax=Brevundimonas sp. TaxID=1871086 RepID=UPI0025B95C29|nr:TonB-dependent receptor [Brevundimonas sp.]